MIVQLLPRVARRRGVTLLELTVVLAFLLTLTSMLFVASRAWKRGSNRANCVLSLRSVQVATRSYQNLYGYQCGGRPNPEDGTQDIAQHLFRKGYIEQNLYEQAQGISTCPSGGNYTCPAPDQFPEEGELYMSCSLSAIDGHLPSSHVDW